MLTKTFSKAAIAMALATAVGVAGLNTAFAQEYPNAPVHFLSGFPPGTAADISARVVGAAMSKVLKQQVVVENRSGAGSSIAAAAAARAPKDGYTVLVSSTANLVNDAMSANLTFDFYKDFSPVTLITSAPAVLVVRPDLGVKSVKDVIALAKSKPDALSFGSSGVASTTHLALELFKALAEVKITHVPYAGSPKVVADLLAGRIDGYFSPASSVMGHVRAGKLLALAVTDPARNPILPELPTMIEAGVPNFESVLWFGLVVPSGTPLAVIEKLAQAANVALKSEETIRSLHTQMIKPIGGTPEEFRQHIASEQKRWTAVIRGAGLGK